MGSSTLPDAMPTWALDTLISSLPGSSPKVLHDLVMESDKPVSHLDPAFISLSKMADTLKVPVKFAIRKDSLHLRRFILHARWEENTEYRLKILPPALTNIYGNSVDTISKSFKTQRSDFYGKLIVTLDSVKNNVIVQLLQKDILIAQKSSRKSGKLVFDFLNPGKYTVKLIYDRNGNGKWDTGRYLLKLQPEKVAFYHSEIDIRSNWDLDISMPGKE